MNNSSLKVSTRLATLTDADAVSQILISSRKAFLPYAPSPHTDADIRYWVEAHLLAESEVTVAVLENIIVGVLAVSSQNAVGWIDQLYIEPHYVNRGIGSQLLDELFSKQQGDFRLYCFQKNIGARALYERYGFAAIEFSDGAYNEERCADVLYERIRKS